MVRGDKSGTKEIDFYYDHNGMRTRKVVRENDREETTDYTLHGKLITHLTKGIVDSEGNETVDHLHFFYDAQSKPAFVEYEGEMYRYIHNLQGDIVAIVDNAGNLVVEYKYDAWGKPISMTGALSTILGILNPFRYRGYVWDEETKLYYLRSRFYCIRIGRFINSDAIVIADNHMSGSNLHVYCRNNYICLQDCYGYRPMDALSVQSETKDQRRASFNYMKLPSWGTKISISSVDGIISAKIFYLYNRTPYETQCNHLSIAIVPNGRIATYLLGATTKPSLFNAVGSTILGNIPYEANVWGYIDTVLSFSEDKHLYNILSIGAEVEDIVDGGFVIVEHEWYYMSDVLDERAIASQTYYHVWNGEDIFQYIK